MLQNITIWIALFGIECSVQVFCQGKSVTMSTELEEAFIVACLQIASMETKKLENNFTAIYIYAQMENSVSIHLVGMFTSWTIWMGASFFSLE